MKLSNYYNFRNPVRHFINIDQLIFPDDIETFKAIEELCWTKPMSFRIYKADDRFRTLKMPNILNYVNALHYYKNLSEFDTIKSLDPDHKRLDANLETGDFVSGSYNLQLNDDFIKLCNYDILVKLDISEYYGRIYTHYLDLENENFKDKPLAWLNNGRTSGLLMGNYLSLFFAEYLLSKIAKDLQKNIDVEKINCVFNYFSDDFYFFCNQNDEEKVLSLFDKTLAEYDFVRKKKKEIWTYETYNTYNLLTRYWKATIRTWNLEILKDYENQKKHPKSPIEHKFSFLNQLIYRLSTLQDEKSKKSFIVNFFKTQHFQSQDYSKYKVCSYDLHQLFFLVKYAPESLLYISHIMNEILGIKNAPDTKLFLKARYEEALKQELHDVQLYFYYAIKTLGFDDILQDTTDLVSQSQNQVLVAYYLKDDIFTEDHISSFKEIKKEEYWFQNYHLILYTPSMRTDLDTNIVEYLIPQKVFTYEENKREVKKKRYLSFYRDNLQKERSLISNIEDVTDSIRKYLKLRYEETATDFED